MSPTTQSNHKKVNFGNYTNNADLTLKTSSYPILFDAYYYKRCPLEMLSSKDNATLSSLLSTDRMIDNYNNDEDGIMKELYNVDISISNASSKTNNNSSSTTVKDEKSMIMELLYIDQLIDKQQQLQQTTSLYDPYTKKEILSYPHNEQYYMDCMTMSSKSFEALLTTDQTIDKSKKEQEFTQDHDKINDSNMILDLLHVDEEIDSYKKNYDPTHVIMDDLHNIDMEIAHASSNEYKDDVEVENILSELLKVDKEIDNVAIQSNPVTLTMLDILYNDRLIDTYKNTSTTPQILIHKQDKDDIVDETYETKVLKGYNYFAEKEKKCDIEDGHNPILLDLWDIDYELSNVQLVNSDFFKAFQTIYNIDTWVNEQEQKQQTNKSSTYNNNPYIVPSMTELNNDVVDLLQVDNFAYVMSLLQVDNFVSNYNVTESNKNAENILNELLKVDNEIDFHHEGFITNKHATIMHPEHKHIDETATSSTIDVDDDIKALLIIDQEIDGCKKKNEEDGFLDILEDLYNVDQEIEDAMFVKNNRDYARKTHDRKHQEKLWDATNSSATSTGGDETMEQKRSIFTGQEKQMALRHSSSELNAIEQHYDDYYEYSHEKEKKFHGVKKLKGKNVCVVM